MPSPVDLKIGSQIRAFRVGKDISEEVLADRLGVTFKQMQRYERGTSRVSIMQLTEIADALGVPMSAFFDTTATTEPENENVAPLPIATRQGLALLRAFHSIHDPQLRHKILKEVEAIANDEAPSEAYLQR